MINLENNNIEKMTFGPVVRVRKIKGPGSNPYNHAFAQQVTFAAMRVGGGCARGDHYLGFLFQVGPSRQANSDQYCCGTFDCACNVYDTPTDSSTAQTSSLPMHRHSPPPPHNNLPER
jgi:hypothetical protein